MSEYCNCDSYLLGEENGTQRSSSLNCHAVGGTKGFELRHSGRKLGTRDQERYRIRGRSEDRAPWTLLCLGENHCVSESQ